MKQRDVRGKTDTIGDEDAMSEAELKQVSGGVVAGAPRTTKFQRPVLSWSGTAYSPEEDVVAY